MKKLFFSSLIIILSVIFCVLPASGQSLEDNAEVREFLDDMFGQLDMSKVPTGLLRDYAFELVDFDRYDGKVLTDSNYVEKTTFEYLLRSIRSSAVGEKPFSPVNSILDDMHNVNDGSIAVGILLYKYNYIREDALDNNLIRYQGDRFYDNYDENGQWINPYAEKYVVGFSSYSRVHKGSGIKFSFPSEFIFTNTEISKLEFDAGDGSGYRQVYAGSSLTVGFNEGEKELKMRITLSTGEMLVCHGTMYSSGGRVELSSAGSTPRPSKPNLTKSFYYSSANGQIAATASVFYAKNKSVSDIIRPFVVVEGFDPMDLADYMHRAGAISNQNACYDDYGFTNAEDLFPAMQNVMDEYDVIYIDWMNSEADIRDNAKLMEQIIVWINEEMADNGSSEGIAVVGQSMGGLIVRYALRSMEFDGINHGVTAFVSHDVPHRGANIPVGMLYAVHSLLSFYYGESLSVDLLDLLTDSEDWVRMVQKYLYSPSASQMLCNFVNQDGQLDNSAHAEWQDEIDFMGFPEGDPDKGMMNFAIVNGGETDDLDGVTSYLQAEGNLHSRFLTDLLSIFSGPILCNFVGIDANFWDYVPGKTNITASIDVFPYLSSGNKVFDMKIIYHKKIIGIFNREVTAFSQTNYAPSSPLAFDAFPGSYYCFSDFISSDADAFNIPFILGSDYEYSVNDRFMFIPTASSLDVGMGRRSLAVNDYTRSYWPDIPQPLVEMPYQAVIAESKASDHISEIENMYEWILEQMRIYISGPLSPKSGDRYVLENCSYPVKWSISDMSIAAIDPLSGEITLKKPGVVKVTATYQYEYGTVSRSKTVMVGLPDFYISTSEDGMVAIATAKCRTNGSMFKMLVDAGLVEYEWGTKTWGNPIEWTVQKDSVFTLGVPERMYRTTIYMRVKTASGLTSPVYSYTFSISDPFTFWPQFIVSNASGELYLRDNVAQNTIEYWPLSLNVRVSKYYDWAGIDPGVPGKIIVNGEKEHWWDEYPGGQSMDVGINFYLFDEDEFEGYRQQMKPWGDTEMMIFKVLVQDRWGKDLMTAPVIFIYLENYPYEFDSYDFYELYNQF